MVTLCARWPFTTKTSPNGLKLWQASVAKHKQDALVGATVCFTALWAARTASTRADGGAERVIGMRDMLAVHLTHRVTPAFSSGRNL